MGRLIHFFVPLLSEFKKNDLMGKRAAFIGLGDRRYEPVLFCQGMETLKETWLAQHGEIVGEPIKINGEPYGQLEGKVKPWAMHIGSLWGETSPGGGQKSGATPNSTGLKKILENVFNHA